MVATGAPNKEIARQLVISPNTVKVHLRNIFAKIGVASRTEATLYAVQIGLVKPNAVQEVQEENGRDESAAMLEPALPGIVIEDELEDGEARTLGTPRDPAAARPRKPWQLGLALLLALALIGSGMVVGARIMATPTPFPTVAALVATQTATNAAQQRWSVKPVLPDARKGMGMVEYESAYFLIGGETDQGIDGVVLRFDTKENGWQSLASKPTRVTDVQAVLLGEKIYVPGGRVADGRSSDALEVYDPREDAWERKAALPNPVSAYALAAFEGQLYLFGGKNGEEYLSSVYVYSPQEDRWEERTAMNAPRAYAGAAVVDGKIHVIGGYDGEHALDENQAYFPTRDGDEDPWEDLNPLPAGRYGMGVTSLASSVYLLGGLGESGKPADPVGLHFLAQTNEWNTFEPPPVRVGAQPALLSSGSFLSVLGGETLNGLSANNLSYQAIYTITVPILRSNGGEE